MDLDELSFDEASGRLFIHFDVSENFLNLETFIETAQNAKKIAEALNQTFFNGELGYEIVVLAPEPGTFLAKYAILATHVGAVFAFLNTGIGAAYVEGLTGHEPAYWAMDVGESHRETLEDAGEWLSEQKFWGDTPDQERCDVASRIVVQMARGILEKEPADLDGLGMAVGDLPEAAEARNEFYKACIRDQNIRGIGFSPEDDFPIPRNAFPARAAGPVRREEDLPEEPPWFVSIENIYATSPNWEKDDQASRQWKGKDSVRRDCYFVIEDEEFWLHVKRKDLVADTPDHLKVQWAYQVESGRPKHRRVLKVLEFNGEKLAEPLSDAAVRTILGQFSQAVVESDQGNLF